MKTTLYILFATLFFYSANANIINIPASYFSIQTGIDNSVNGDTIIVAPGVYYENINFNGKNIVVASLYLTTGDTGYISSTILTPPPNPQPNGSIVTFENGETHDVQLTGFTLQGGTGNYRHLGFDNIYYGGAVYCDHASPRLSHLIVKENIAECGGGIFLYFSNSVVENCVIMDNTCNSISFSSPDAGGGIACWNCTGAIIRNNRILNNTVSTAGAAIYTLNSTVSVINSLVTGNYSMNLGSAFYADSWSHLNITNCTVYGNHCDPGNGIAGAGIIYCIDSAKVRINNSIFYYNNPATLVCQFNYGRNEVTVSHSDFEGGIDSIITNNNGNNVDVNWLTGNITSDPQFVDTTLNNFHLKDTSPCINSGDTTGLNDIPAVDLDNNNRYVGVIDMGCFENAGSSSLESPVTRNQFYSFPNPADETLYLINNSAQMINFSLFNINGQIISNVYLSSGKARTLIDVSKAAEGIYFLKCESENNFIGSKILIKHDIE